MTGLPRMVKEYDLICPCHHEFPAVNHGEETGVWIRTVRLVPDERSFFRRLIDRLWPVSA